MTFAEKIFYCNKLKMSNKNPWKRFKRCIYRWFGYRSMTDTMVHYNEKKQHERKM